VQPRAGAVVSVNTGSEPGSLIIITSVALVLLVIFLMFTFWLCMTKRVPRFSVCDGSRGKYRKKKTAKYLNNISSESDTGFDIDEPEKQNTGRPSQIELYMVAPPGESSSAVSEGDSLMEINTGAGHYYNEQEHDVSNPRLIYSTIATKIITPDAYERESSTQSSPIINPSLVIEDSDHWQPRNIAEQSSISDVKDALSEYLTARDTDIRESELCKSRSTREVPNMELYTPRETHEIRAIQDDGLSSSEDNGSEGENSNSAFCVASVLKDHQPNPISSHLDVNRTFLEPKGERNAKPIEYSSTPGEEIPQRKQTLGTRYLNNLRIGDSFNVGPLLGNGESSEENDIFGNDSRIFEAKNEKVQLIE